MYLVMAARVLLMDTRSLLMDIRLSLINSRGEITHVGSGQPTQGPYVLLHTGNYPLFDRAFLLVKAI